MSIIIPDSLQIVLDDVGWRNGADDRKNGGPSRTGISRRHVPSDYRAINELGELIGMKINCAFVIGEWDPDNRLRSVPHLSKYGEKWNNAAYVDPEEMAEIVDIINSSPYIDIAVHGLMHGYYKEGNESFDSSDYYYINNGEFIMNPESEIRERLDLYFGILKHYGVKKNINSFVPPSFTYRYRELSRIVADYGIVYNTTIFKKMVFENGQAPESCVIEDGIITLDRNLNPIPWDGIGSRYDDLPVRAGIFGAHWPNILAEDPKNNSETVKNAAAYFKRCADTFGIILSKDLAFAVNQTVYKKYAKVSVDGGIMTVDLTDIPTGVKIGDSFFISADTPIVGHSGCDIELHETKSGFANYRVTPFDKTVRIHSSV